jgi:hypothetical protein
MLDQHMASMNHQHRSGNQGAVMNIVFAIGHLKPPQGLIITPFGCRCGAAAMLPMCCFAIALPCLTLPITCAHACALPMPRSNPLYGDCKALNTPKGKCKVVTGYDFVGDAFTGVQTGPAAIRGGMPVSLGQSLCRCDAAACTAAATCIGSCVLRTQQQQQLIMSCPCEAAHVQHLLHQALQTT